MGSSYSSHTNLGSDCTSFDAGATGTIARWGDSFEVSMGTSKESDHTDVWGAEYKLGQMKKHSCGFQLKATRDNNGVESIHFGLGDSSAENKTEFALKITRVGRDGLHGGITGIDSCGAPMSFTKAKENYSIETTLVSYRCSQRDGLFVLEMRKKVNSDDAYMATLAHYYVTKDISLSVVAKIHRNNGNGFGVEVKGPFKHPSVDLRKVIVKTCSNGVWSPTACSHRNQAKASTGSKTGVSNSSLKPQSHNQSEPQSHNQSNDTVVQIVREQSNTGLINSSGYTTGSLNNSIIFVGCNLGNLDHVRKSTDKKNREKKYPPMSGGRISNVKGKKMGEDTVRNTDRREKLERESD